MVDASMVLSLIVMGLLVSVLFGALIPTIADFTIGLPANTSASNVSGATGALTPIVPVALAVVAIVGILSMAGFRLFGR